MDQRDLNVPPLNPSPALTGWFFSGPERLPSLTVCRPRPRRLEYRDTNGCVVNVTVPEGMDDDDVISALSRAAKHLRKERASRPEVAQDAA